MQIDVRHGSIYEGSTAAIVVGVFEGEEIQASQAALLDNALNGLVSEMVANGEFEGKAGQTVVLYPHAEFSAQRAVLVGLGKREKLDADALRKAAASAARQVRDLRRTEFEILTPDALPAETVGAAIAEGAVLGLYRFLRYKTDDESKKQQGTNVEGMTLVTGNADAVDGLQRGANLGRIVAEASCYARDLANLPSNELTPVRFAEEAQRLAQDVGLRCEIWDENEMRQRGMGALLGVAQGSANPPRFIILEHIGAAETPRPTAPIAFAGKGVTFDTGGISIKPSGGMEDMKMDMAGAGAVIAAMGAVARLKVPQRVLGVVAAVENMPSGTAQRPGDIVRAYNGKTIEVLNTDAEGRLILADAVAVVSEQKPQAIIDLATLTGAVVVALGSECAGMMGNDASLMNKIRAAADASGDKVWELPLWDEYKEHVKGQLADVKNVGKNRTAGAIAGAAFISHFVGEDIPWAHLDIAGAAWTDETPLNVKGPTGWGVRLLVYLLKLWGNGAME
jgi:leucyl aminopeptidase